MSTMIKVKHKGQVTIPIRLRSQIGLAEGDFLEARAQNGKIVLTPQAPVSGHRSLARHQIIDTRLARAEADIKAGRVSRPFSDHNEFIEELHRVAAKLASKKDRRPAR